MHVEVCASVDRAPESTHRLFAGDTAVATVETRTCEHGVYFTYRFDNGSVHTVEPRRMCLNTLRLGPPKAHPFRFRRTTGINVGASGVNINR